MKSKMRPCGKGPLQLQIRLAGALFVLSAVIRFRKDYRSMSDLLPLEEDILSSSQDDWRMTSHPPIVHPRMVHLDESDPLQVFRLREVTPMAGPPTRQGRSYFEPLDIDQSMCTPATSWQTQIHPSCNNLHELNTRNFKYLGSGGWRMAFGYNNVVVKMLKLEQHFDALTYRRHATDAIIADRLTSSPRVMNACGFCGQTILSEKAERSLTQQIKALKRNKTVWKEQLIKRVQYARDAAAALASVHKPRSNNHVVIAHHDIKPDNFMIAAGDRLVINDFNDAELLWTNTTSKGECQFRRKRWSIFYKSPQDIRQRPLTHKSDIYSLGGVLYYLLTGNHPYHDAKKTMAARQIGKGILPELPVLDKNHNPQLVATMIEVIQQCWAYDPLKRPSSRKVAEKLKRALDAAAKQS